MLLTPTIVRVDMNVSMSQLFMRDLHRVVLSYWSYVKIHETHFQENSNYIELWVWLMVCNQSLLAAEPDSSMFMKKPYWIFVWHYCFIVCCQEHMKLMLWICILSYATLLMLLKLFAKYFSSSCLASLFFNFCIYALLVWFYTSFSFHHFLIIPMMLSKVFSTAFHNFFTNMCIFLDIFKKN